MATNTNPLASGITTSEGVLTTVAMIVGTLVEGLGGFLSHENALHSGNTGWAIAVVVAGALLQAATLFGYTRGRSFVKSTLINALVTQGLPLTLEVIQAVADKMNPPTPPVGPISVPTATSTQTVYGAVTPAPAHP